MNKEDWSAALKGYVRDQRRARPIPARDTLSDEDEWHCRIIGGEFMRWYRRHLPDILGQRMVLGVMQFDPEPIIVVTTSMPGMVAMQEILSQLPDDPVYLLHDEFMKWEKDHSADLFTFHIHHWSYFRQIHQELLERARVAFPDVSTEQFRLHASGDLWGEQCGMEGSHLWQWDGQEMELLEEGFSHRVF